MNNILGYLDILRMYNMKPNFSELARKYNLSRQTVKKYFIEGGKRPITRKRESGFDIYKEEILELFKTSGVTKRAVYEYLKDQYKDIPTYSSFRAYTIANDIRKMKDTTPHVRYETDLGEVLQIDWKESLRMTSIYGEVFEFDIMSAILGYSRYSKFIYTKSKTTEDFLRCTIDVFNSLGGIPKKILTDNMSAVVSIIKNEKNKAPEDSSI
jgi:transposase